MAVTPAAACQTPATFCNNWVFESTQMQRYLLLQLLAAIAVDTSVIESALPAALLAASEAWKCASGNDPERLRMMEAQMIAGNLPGADTEQPVCLTPLDQEAIIAHLICALSASMIETPA